MLAEFGPVGIQASDEAFQEEAMRQPRFRFTLRWMLVAVALVAALLACTELCRRYWAYPRWRITGSYGPDYDRTIVIFEFDMRWPRALQDWRQTVSGLKARKIDYRIEHLPASKDDVPRMPSIHVSHPSPIE